MTNREQVRDFLSNLLKSQDDTRPFEDSDSLVLSGRLNSIDLVEIFSFLEGSFGFSLAPSQFDLFKFDSVDNIVALLENAKV
jgi:acyl carrier protein